MFPVLAYMLFVHACGCPSVCFFLDAVEGSSIVTRVVRHNVTSLFFVVRTERCCMYRRIEIQLRAVHGRFRSFIKKQYSRTGMRRKANKNASVKATA